MRATFKSAVKSNRIIHRFACQTQRNLVAFRAHIDSIKNKVIYSAPIRPFNLIEINPEKINLMLADPFENRRFRDLSPVISGEWDQETESLHDYDLFYSVYNHFKYEVPWEETDLYPRVRDEIESTDDWRKWGCTDFEEFNDRLDSLDQLYNVIKQDGYRTQRDIQKGSTDPINTRACLPPEWHEVTVHIGRDGEPIFHEGRHRLAIARAIGLDSVPVRVMVRHQRWQALRDRIYNEETDVNPDVSQHPDIVWCE